MKQKLLLKNFQSPGDIVMLTAAVRDLVLAHGDRFAVQVQTSCPDLWLHNPHLSDFDVTAKDVRVIRCEYPLIHKSNTTPYHFIHGFVQCLESCLGKRIPITAFKGDIHLSNEERGWVSRAEELGVEGDYWIIVAGGKFDFTAKWWNPDYWQQVVDHFAGKITFIQVGEAGHYHPPLKGVVNEIGKTNIRQMLRMIYHSAGVLCPITLAMHAAAAVPIKRPVPKNRPCVVVAGGREPAQWEAYPHHRFLSTNGAFACCDNGGCWKSRCQPVGDGDPKDKDLCVLPVLTQSGTKIAACMDEIKPVDVIRAMEMYYRGGVLKFIDPSV